MKVLMFSTDANILKEGSAVRARMTDYGTICDELHIIIPVFSFQFSVSGEKLQIEQNVFAYPAIASNKILALIKAYGIGIGILSENLKLKTGNWVITSQDPFETGLIAWLISKKTGVGLELQIHTDFLSGFFSGESLTNKIRVSLAKFLLPKADGIRVVSERILNSLKTENLKLKTNPAVLPIFSDIEAIRKKEPVFNLHGKYPQFDFIVLMMSRLSREKNIAMAIRSMAEVMKNHPKAGLVVVGNGPEEKNLKLKTENLKINKNVIFEKWTDDPVSYYKTADIFLNTSNYEGFGLSIVEAVAADCPVVSTDVGVIDGVLRHEENILACPPGNEKCITENINRLIAYPDLRRNISLKAQTALQGICKSKEDYLKSMKECWERASK